MSVEFIPEVARSNKVDQIGNVDLLQGIAVDIALFMTRRWRAKSVPVVNEVADPKAGLRGYYGRYAVTRAWQMSTSAAL